MFSFLKSFQQSQNNLKEVLQQNPVLIDVRTTAEFAGGSVTGAKNIPLATLPVRLNEIPKDQPVVVFCQSGGRSGSALQVLESAGYTNVLNGGGWQNVQNYMQ